MGSAIDNNIPAEIYYGKLDLAKLKVFGAKVWAVVLPRGTKLDESSSNKNDGLCTKRCRLWDPEAKKIIISRDVPGV